MSIADIASTPDGVTVVVTGRIHKVTSTYTRQGRPWAYAVLADEHARVGDFTVETQLFPNEYETYGAQFTLGARLEITGRVSHRDNVARLSVEHLRTVEEATR
jgi:DNA polymerase III alpha subunit